MLELIVEPEATNKALIKKTRDNLTALCQMFLDLKAGETIHFNDFILSPTGYLAQDTTAFYLAPDNLISYLVVELPLPQSNDQLVIDSFETLSSGLEGFFPSLYKEILSYCFTKENISSVFSKRTTLVFQFRNDILEMISTLPWDSSIEEYVNSISLRKSNLDVAQQDALLNLFNNTKTSLSLPSGRSGYSYYSYHRSNSSTSKAVLFIKKNYFRLNTFEFNNDKVSWTILRSYLTGTYKANAHWINLITALVNPGSVNNTFSKTYLGNAILTAATGIQIPITKNVYPTLVDILDEKVRNDTNNFFVELSNDDAAFVNNINTLDVSLLYTKHKEFLTWENKSEIRGCKAIFNASKTLKVVVREEKKKLSDEEAYKNRVFRDYLSYAVSLVAIPIFQKEFVMPECWSKSFVFRMASLHSCYYKQPYRNTPRVSERYWTNFDPSDKPIGWVMPIIPDYIPVKKDIVSSFVEDYKKKEITSTTQSRSSVFTRYFVEPFIETSPSSYSMPKACCMFGWMMNLDDQTLSNWSYKQTDSSLLRNTAPRGYFYRECGLVSDKTFGIQAIMANIFSTAEFSGYPDEYSIINPKQIIAENKRGQYISAVMDIYSANFVPITSVENAIQSFGTISFNSELARVNQLLFLQDQGLNILNGLYSCETFEDLSICLSLCMPICLDILEELNYSTELKAHVRNMLNYFWNTTTAIAEELKPHDTVKE